MAALDRMALVCGGVTLSTSIACASTETPSFSNATEESTASSSSSTTGGTEDAACACIRPPNPGGGLLPPTCGSRLCEVYASCPSGGPGIACLDEPEATHDEAGLGCALEALAARTPGYIQWTFGYPLLINGYEIGYIVIRDDGRAITQSSVLNEAFAEYRGATLGAMPSPQHFEHCAASTSLATRFGCLIFEPEQPDSVCDLPW